MSFKQNLKFSIASCLFLLLASRSPAQNSVAGQKVDAYIKQQMRENHIVGLSLAVVKDGKVVKAAGYGLANIETNTPATPATIYKIASVSKQFLAAGIMMLVHDGKIRLDDKVSSYVTGTPRTWQDITVRELLTHTAGLPLDPPGFEPFKADPDSAVLAGLFTETPLLFAPGENISYSNAGYFVVAAIIRKVSGMPWSEFLNKRIFSPLQMSSTRPTSVSDVLPGRANGYHFKDSVWTNAENWIAVRPSGAFLSTVADMAKWDLALDTDEPLSADSRKQMWTPVQLKNGTAVPYGFGWGLQPWQGHNRVGHNGGLPGFSADFERFIDDKLTVIVLSNMGGVDAGKIAFTVAGFYIAALTPQPEKPAPAHP